MAEEHVLYDLIKDDRDRGKSGGITYPLKLSVKDYEELKKYAVAQNTSIGAVLRTMIKEAVKEQKAIKAPEEQILDELEDLKRRIDEIETSLKQVEELKEKLEQTQKTLTDLEQMLKTLDKNLNIIGYYFVEYYKHIKQKKSYTELLNRAIARLKEVLNL